MRHGRTVWNEKGIVQGFSSNRLSSSGKEMVELAAAENKNQKFDYIICSPLMRTVQTANIMNKYHNAKIIKDSRIIEIAKGVLSGRVKKTITDEERKVYNQDKKKYGIETMQELYVRVNDFLKSLKKDFQNSRVLVVTHGAVVSTIKKISIFGEYSAKEFETEFNIPNAQVLKIEI